VAPVGNVGLFPFNEAALRRLARKMGNDAGTPGRLLQVALEEVLVEVRDHGSGVEDVDRIFEPFFTTKENGMGMGLAICRSIVEAHDGHLRATKNEPCGTTLTFTLPGYSSESQ